MMDWSVGENYAVGQLGVEWEEEVQCWMPQKKKERWEVETSGGQRYVQGKAAMLADEIMGRVDPRGVGVVLELRVSADQFMRGEAVEKIQERFREAGLRGHRSKAKATVALGHEAIANMKNGFKQEVHRRANPEKGENTKKETGKETVDNSGEDNSGEDKWCKKLELANPAGLRISAIKVSRGQRDQYVRGMAHRRPKMRR